ncbi:uncharacterized protein EDB91DRAFT_1334460 [Suillus paluster]|uniref:uncharacterized protein n=1 Tax=Suillus paluster TaxID=48578 RepID=UPI001B8847B7|nr:uncharacterized protein EDB91DRAFT_1334460 [Suillus paluster]KAG1749081.1 hypothetical protein EDB91DRAFT_1334460 [Suillus paluster]
MLRAIPRRIPCLTLDGLYMTRSTIITMQSSMKIGADKVILRRCIEGLAVIDDNCQTIVLHRCDSVEDLCGIPLPPSNSMEFDECASNDSHIMSSTCKWNGDTVTIMNSDSSCIKVILVFIGAPLNGHVFCRWPRVTTLKLTAKGDFVMKFPVGMLKAIISSRREVAGQENLEKDDNGMDSESFHPIKVLHVHGGPALSRKESTWFEEHVRDFV